MTGEDRIGRALHDEADDHMRSREPPVGTEFEAVLPLSRTRVELRGDAYYRGSVVRRVHALLGDLADEVRAAARAIERGEAKTLDVWRLLDIAEQAERIGREAMDGIDGEEHTGGGA